MTQRQDEVIPNRKEHYDRFREALRKIPAIALSIKASHIEMEQVWRDKTYVLNSTLAIFSGAPFILRSQHSWRLEG